MLKVFISWFVQYLKWLIPGVECFTHCCIPAPIPIQSPTSWGVYGRNSWLLILGNTSQCLQQKKKKNFRAGWEPFFFFFFNFWWSLCCCNEENSLNYRPGSCSHCVSGAPHQEFLPVPLSLLEDPAQVSWSCLSGPTGKWCALKSNSGSALFRFISTLPRNSLQLCTKYRGGGGNQMFLLTREWCCEVPNVPRLHLFRFIN